MAKVLVSLASHEMLMKRMKTKADDVSCAMTPEPSMRSPTWRTPQRSRHYREPFRWTQFSSADGEIERNVPLDDHGVIA